MGILLKVLRSCQPSVKNVYYNEHICIRGVYLIVVTSMENEQRNVLNVRFIHIYQW